MRFAALLTITLIAVASIGLPPTAALAQSQLTDRQLMQLLVQLTVRKGYKDVELAPEVCETLGLPLKPGVSRENGCSVYQAAHAGGGWWRTSGGECSGSWGASRRG
jgi:hypothetical protein